MVWIVCERGMLDLLTKHWFTKGLSTYAQKYCQSCMICAAHIPAKIIPITQAAQPPPEKQFDYMMIDFIEVTPCEGKRYYLIMVDVVKIG